MPEQLCTLLDGLIEAERGYKQTQSDERAINRSHRRIRLMEKMRLMSNGSTVELDDAAEAALKLDIEHLAERDWDMNQICELINQYQEVRPKP